MAKREDAEMRDDMELAQEGSGPRVYELGFHLDPELPTEEVKKAFQAVRDLVESKGSLVAVGEPLQMQLAYTISRQETGGRRDFNSAFFAWIAYETSPENHAAVIEAAKEDARIIRFIDVLTTKDAARHAAELRELATKAPAAEAAEEERASDTALDAALEGAAV